MQIPYIPERGRKVPRVMGGNIESKKEISESSGLPIPMVPHLNQSNGYIKRKLRVWRVEKCIALVYADTVLTSAAPQTTPCHGGLYRVHKGNMRNFEPTNPHGTAFSPKRWLHENEATGSVQKGNVRKFGPTNPHGTAFAPKQRLYEKEATGMES